MAPQKAPLVPNRSLGVSVVPKQVASANPMSRGRCKRTWSAATQPSAQVEGSGRILGAGGEGAGK